MDNLLEIKPPLTEAEKFDKMLQALLISQNALELAKKAQLPTYIAEAAWKAVADTFTEVSKS